MKEYLFVQKISETQEIVLDPASKQLCMRKYLGIYDENVYRFLLCHHHPNVVSLIDMYHDGRRLVIIEEKIEGETLQWHLDAHDLSEKEKEAVFDDILDGVQFLHHADPPVIHRDLKPENIMITPDKSACIIDFNAAKITRRNKAKDTVLIGTEGSAAPEQYGFSESDERTDIYALGKLAALLFPERKHFADRASAFDPDRRYQNIAEMRRAFHNPVTPYSWEPYAAAKKTTILRFYLFQLLFLWLDSFITSGSPDRSVIIWNRFCFLAMLETLYMLYAKWTPLFRLLEQFESQNIFIRILIYAFVSFAIIFLFASLALIIQ